MLKRVVLFMFCCAAHSFSILAQNTDMIRDEIVKFNLESLIDYYNSNPSLAYEIEDAIDGYLDWDFYTYEQIKDAKEKCQIKDGYLKKELERVAVDKECEIYQYISTITPEQLEIYAQEHPYRKELIDKFLNEILYKSLGHNSYANLISLEAGLTGVEFPGLRETLQTRENEKALLIKEKIDDFLKFESAYKNRLMFVLKYRSWQYFIVRYRDVARIYSKIGIVPDNPEQMGSQFSYIIRTCFTKEDFRAQLKKDIDAYNNAINMARKEYVKMAGIMDYTKSDIIIPNIGSFSVKPNLTIARKIATARNEFNSSREVAKTAAGIAGLFVGTITSSIGRGLYDLHAVSELANKEMLIRREYMRDAYNQLHKVFANYFSILDKEISSQIAANNLKFKNYVKSQK